jgi:hypothetical protein
VQLSDFELQTAGGAAIVAWKVPDSVDMLGCNVYRSKPGTDVLERINASLIVAATIREAKIETADTSASPADPYDYWLEVVFTGGRTRLLGPRRVGELGRDE